MIRAHIAGRGGLWRQMAWEVLDVQHGESWSLVVEKLPGGRERRLC